MDYYSVLHLSRDASAEEIKQQYKLLAKKYHPDKAPSDKIEEYTSKFKEIKEAYTILIDPDKKDIYDKYGKEGLDENNNPGHPGNFNFHNINPFDFMFRRGGDRRDNNTNIRIKHKLTLEEIYTGVKITLNYNRSDPCDSCNSTGYEDKNKHVCNTCKGSGRIVQVIQMGPMIQQMATSCNICSGSGRDTREAKKCNICNGNRTINQSVNLSVDVPKGISKEQTMNIKDQGNYNPDNNTRGSVELVISEKKHGVFSRGVSINGKINPENIAITINLSMCEALCGFKRSFKHLDNNIYDIFEEDIIKHGDIKIITGRGMPVLNSNRYGDLFVKYNVNYLDSLNHDQKIMIYKALTGEEYQDLDLDSNKDRLLFTMSPENINQDNNSNTSNEYQDQQEFVQQGQCVHQ